MVVLRSDPPPFQMADKEWHGRPDGQSDGQIRERLREIPGDGKVTGDCPGRSRSASGNRPVELYVQDIGR